MPADTPHQNPTETDTLQQQIQAWARIMDASDNLLQLAKQKDWDAVTEHHQHRDQLLEEFFRQALHSDLVDSVQAGIAQIIQQDTEITQWVQNNRDELGEEAQRLRGLRQRAQQYGSVEK